MAAGERWKPSALLKLAELVLEHKLVTEDVLVQEVGEKNADVVRKANPDCSRYPLAVKRAEMTPVAVTWPAAGAVLVPVGALNDHARCACI